MEDNNAPALRVLIADDNDAVAKTFTWMLEALGHHACYALDGPAAIKLAQEFKPEVIMLDINLPGMNGYEVCQVLRQQPGLENTVFMAQTGWNSPEHLERSRKAGFHHHLVKPVTLERLQEVLTGLRQAA